MNVAWRSCEAQDVVGEEEVRVARRVARLGARAKGPVGSFPIVSTGLEGNVSFELKVVATGGGAMGCVVGRKRVLVMPDPRVEDRLSQKFGSGYRGGGPRRLLSIWNPDVDFPRAASVFVPWITTAISSEFIQTCRGLDKQWSWLCDENLQGDATCVAGRAEQDRGSASPSDATVEDRDSPCSSNNSATGLFYAAITSGASRWY